MSLGIEKDRVPLPGRALSEVDFCVIDTETTGGNAELSRVIDVAVLHFRGGEIVETYQSLINPGRPIPGWITELTGISDRMVEDAPTFDQIAGTLHAFLQRGVFVAHNASFDYGFIREEFRRVGLSFERPQLCTLKIARSLYSDLPSRSLGVLCENLFIDIWDRHRAFGDAEATVYVLKEMLRCLGEKAGLETWADLEAYVECGKLKLPGAVALADILRLPAAPGKFVCLDEKGVVLLEGKAQNVRNRVRLMFRERNVTKKSDWLRGVVHRIEFRPAESIRVSGLRRRTEREENAERVAL